MAASTITKEVRAVRSTLMITNVATMEQLIERSLLRERLVAVEFVWALAVLLSVIGLYGIR